MTDLERQKLIDNVAAGKLAREVVDMVRDDLPTADMKERFVENVRDQLIGPRAEAPEPVHESWERLASVVMLYGAHEGRMLKDVPFGYLDWLVARQEDGIREIRDYLKHPETREKRDREHANVEDDE